MDMTPYRRYNKPQSDRDKQSDTQPKKAPLSVFELQCITVFLIIAALLLLKAFAAEMFEKINGFLSGALGEKSSSVTSSSDTSSRTTAEQLSDYIAGLTQSSPTETSVPETSSIQDTDVPENATASDLADFLSGLSAAGGDTLSTQAVSISDYKIENEQAVSYYGDLVPLSLLTETDTKKTDSFAQKAEGGLLKAPDGCSFEPYFCDIKLNAPLSGKIYSKFGYRYHPITGLFGFHTGVDIAANSGSAIYAAAAGKVIERGYSDVWGNYMLIEHSDSTDTFYAHCKKLLKSKGAKVKSGERIATVGSTGWATGPHLHFEVRLNKVNMDPEWIL